MNPTTAPAFAIRLPGIVRRRAWMLALLLASLLLRITPTYASTIFYVDPDSGPAVWTRTHAADPRAARIAQSIAAVPMAHWFGNWSGDIRAAVAQHTQAAQAAHGVPLLVAYNLPQRDCGGASAGGALDAAAYRDWIEAFSQGIGARAAIVVIEPDALAQLDCLKSAPARAARLALLRYTVARLRQNAPAAQIYLDAGNAHWIAADVMAQRLDAAGARDASGFALNVSNFYATDRSLAYARAVNAELEKQFGYHRSVIVDTSRNANGSHGQWCNPAGSKLGVRTGYAPSGALLAWIKAPGNSDGACGIAPTLRAGLFSPELAERLIDGR